MLRIKEDRAFAALIRLGLSSREARIFCGLAVGQLLSEICVDLSISIKTASTYKSRIFGKLDPLWTWGPAARDAQLVYFAVKQRWLYETEETKHPTLAEILPPSRRSKQQPPASISTTARRRAIVAPRPNPLAQSALRWPVNR